MAHDTGIPYHESHTRAIGGAGCRLVEGTGGRGLGQAGAARVQWVSGGTVITFVHSSICVIIVVVFLFPLLFC